mmetsp:Transcript_6785/g.12228  ORF Transcript_6785/g.12228 Transcript_6785/m.12228 type:complete len:312 (-) Transcript_6785:2646-3581(-)
MKRKRQARTTKKALKKESSPEHSLGDESTDDIVETPPAKSQSLMRYDALLSQYLENGMTQQIILIIRRVASEPVIPIEIKSQPLLQLMVATAKELQLNEFEVIVWALYLRKFVWRDNSLTLVTKLMYAGLAAKTYMNEDTEAIQSYLNAKHPKFTENFNSWLLAYRGRMSITPRQMNEAFRELSTTIDTDDKSGVVDYNFYVDEILELSHAYVTAQERAILEELKKSSTCRCKEHKPEYYDCMGRMPMHEPSDCYEHFNFGMVTQQSVMNMLQPSAMMGQFEAIVSRSNSGTLGFPYDHSSFSSMPGSLLK